MPIDFLRRVHPFVELDGSGLEELASMTIERVYAQGEHIFRFGDPAGSLFVVWEGAVTLFRDRPGQPIQLQARLGRGQVFGETGLFDDAARSASATAGSNSRILAAPPRVNHQPAAWMTMPRPASNMYGKPSQLRSAERCPASINTRYPIEATSAVTSPPNAIHRIRWTSVALQSESLRSCHAAITGSDVNEIPNQMNIRARTCPTFNPSEPVW